MSTRAQGHQTVPPTAAAATGTSETGTAASAGGESDEGSRSSSPESDLVIVLGHAEGELQPGGNDGGDGDEKKDKDEDRDDDDNDDDDDNGGDASDPPHRPASAALCPLSNAVLLDADDAVVAPDGVVYARAAWAEWVRFERGEGGRTAVRSPMDPEEELKCDVPGDEDDLYGARAAAAEDLARQAHAAPWQVPSMQRLRDVLSGLDEVRQALPAAGAAARDMLRLVAVGREDTGKSSTLARLTNLGAFATSDDVEAGGGDGVPPSRTCTRCPVRLQLRHAPGEYGVPRVQLVRRCGPGDGDGVVVCEELAPCEGLHRRIHRLGTEAVRRAEADQEAEAVDGGGGGRARPVGVTRRYYVRVELRSELAPDVDLLDTPGLVSYAEAGDPPDLARQTREVVRGELTEAAAHTFVLAVLEPNKHPKDEPVLHLVQEAGLADRTLRVLTKMDTGDATAPRNFKQELEAAGERLEGVPAERLVLRLHARQSAMGAVGVANLGADAVREATGDGRGAWFTDVAAVRLRGEHEVRERLGLDDESFGVSALMARVQRLYLGHALSAQLQGLRDEVGAELRKTLDALAALGMPEPLLPEQRSGATADDERLRPARDDSAYREAVLRALRESGACETAADAAGTAAVSGPVREALARVLTAAEAAAAEHEASPKHASPCKASAALAAARAGLAETVAHMLDGVARRAGEAAATAARAALSDAAHELVPSRLARLVSAVATACGEAVREAVSGAGLEATLAEAARRHWRVADDSRPGTERAAFRVGVRLDAAAVGGAVRAADALVIERVGAALGGGGEAAWAAAAALDATLLREEHREAREARAGLWQRVAACERGLATLDRVERLAAAGADDEHAAEARLAEEAWRSSRERLPLPAEVPWFVDRALTRRAAGRPLRAVVYGAGLTGLAFAVSLVEYLGIGGVRVTLVDTGASVSDDAGGARRNEVVTLRDGALRALSVRTRRRLLAGAGGGESVWGAGSRSVLVAAAEDRLRELLSEDGELAEAVDVVSVAGGHADAFETPAMQRRLRTADVVVAADGARSPCCERVLRPGDGYQAREADGETPRVDHAVAVEFQLPPGAELPHAQADNVALTLAQRRFVLNAGAGQHRGCLYVLVSREEFAHVRRADGEACTAQRPAALQWAADDDGDGDHDEKHDSGAMFWPACEDAPPEARRVWEAVRAGLRLYGLKERHVAGVVGVQMRLQSRARYAVQEQSQLGLVLGDAAMQTCDWAGRGVNTGLLTAAAAAFCAASMAQRSNAMSQPCSEVHEFEGFMAALAKREVDGRGGAFLCSASLVERGVGVPGAVGEVGREELLGTWAEAVERHGQLGLGVADAEALRRLARAAAEGVSSSELQAMLRTGPWPEARPQADAYGGVLARVQEECAASASDTTSKADAVERLRRHGMREVGSGSSAAAVAAAAAWRADASQGHAGSQYYLGTCYAAAHGVPKDEARAAELYRQAAEQGVPRALLSLALCYDNGRGVPQDKGRAVELYREAADRGDANAADRLAEALFNRARLLMSGADGALELSGHSNQVTCIAFSPDGTRVVSGSADATARVWNSSGGDTPATRLEGHAGSVVSVCFSPNGALVASGSEDCTLRVWDGASGREIQSWTHPDVVRSVSFTPDGTRLVSGCYDGVVRVWPADVASGDESGRAPALELAGHAGRVLSVACAPDGARFASGADDKTVRVWEAASGRGGAPPRLLEGHAEAVTSVAFSADGTRVVSGSYDKTVRVWDLASGGVRHVLERHADTVTAVAFSPDGTRVVSGSADQTVLVWDLSSGEVVEELAGHTGAVRSVAFSPKGARVASGAHDMTVRVWNAAPTAARAAAVHAYAEASGLGHASAQFNLGRFYWHGSGGTAKDESKAAELYRLAAKQGHARAQGKLGFMYQNGRGVAKDDAKAAELYEMAADQGNAYAQHALAVCYLNGTGVARDPELADRYFLAAAEQGHAESQCAMGKALVTGRTIPGHRQNTREAAQWFRRAAAQGHAEARYQLGWCHETGTGVPRDTAAALVEYGRAAGQSHAGAAAGVRRLS